MTEQTTPTPEQYRRAAIYAAARGSNTGLYGTRNITAQVNRVNDTWRVAGCCTDQQTPCWLCTELFAEINPPAKPTDDFTPDPQIEQDHADAITENERHDRANLNEWQTWTEFARDAVLRQPPNDRVRYGLGYLISATEVDRPGWARAAALGIDQAINTPT